MNSQDSALQETEDEHIEILLRRECTFKKMSYNYKLFGWLERDRFYSVLWILKMNSKLQFNPQTTYLAITYLDRFLLLQPTDDVDCLENCVLRLSSVACILLAFKMEEIKPPALSFFQREEGYGFDNSSIYRMELLVLNTLEWRMSSVTPFAYLNYFASKLQSDLGIDDRLSRTTKFIFIFAEENSVVGDRSSTVAIAAILATSDQTLTKSSIQSKMTTISVPGSLETEGVFSCYSLMIQGGREVTESTEESLGFDDSADDATTSEDSTSKDSSFKSRRLL